MKPLATLRSVAPCTESCVVQAEMTPGQLLTARGLEQLHCTVLVDDDPEIVLMLLARGGLVDVRNLQGRTVLNLAEAKKRCATLACNCF
jgi:hypothetical protein